MMEGDSTETTTPFCCRCLEDFPLSKGSRVDAAWPVRMGVLYPKSRFGKNVKDRLSDNSDYLCGNCYFDLMTD